MTEAAAPRGPSASQLSENIGDVLASIRSMIAQDPVPDTDRAAVLRLEAVGPRPAASPEVPSSRSGLGWVSTPPVQADRDELLVRAQSWTRRQPPGPGPLRLGRSELVAPLREVERAGASDPTESDQSATLLSTREAAAEASAQLADTKDCVETIADRPTNPLHGVPPAELPQFNSDALHPSVSAERAAEPIPALSETVLLETAMNAYAPTQPTGDPINTNGAETEDAVSGSILSGMIREVIRQELVDPGMSRELRAMVLREVARAITGEASKAS
ncbi:hypothetical protein DRW48_06660 [Paracoccus suum]|uniref:Uncharacterized protein n=1 Tax=Paracoccus suum TaxID=2259340 RepID=A0A344PJ59_9RHOB|nr:hypothetical protein [Paracoccus suum]AXC49414.1 hypothetical protein DRW48_06660 [Paracoccus suum]